MRSRTTLAMFFLGMSAAITMAALIPATQEEKALSRLDGVAVREIVWTGETDISPRAGGIIKAAWIGAAALLTGNVVTAVCASPALAATIYPCIVAAIIGGVAAGIAIWQALTTTDGPLMHQDDTLGGRLIWNEVDGDKDRTPVQRLLDSYENSNKTLPVHLGYSVCDESSKLSGGCLSFWYDQRFIRQGRKRLHHVYTSPRHFDYREFVASRNEEQAKQTILGTPTRLAARNSPTETVTGAEETPTGGGSTDYYGGIMFDEGNSGTLKNIVNIGQSGILNDIASEMSSDYTSSGKFGNSGGYCMDFTTSTSGTKDTSEGTDGFTYAFDKPSGFPSASVSGSYNTCAEEGVD